VPYLNHTLFKTLRGYAGLALALFVLNFALTFHNAWPTPWITTRHELSIEIAVLLLVLAFYAYLHRSVSPRLMTALAIVLTIMTIGRYAEVTSPALYGRPVNIYWDAQYLPHVAAMLIESMHPLFVLGMVMAGLLLLFAIFMLLRHALAHIAYRCTHRDGFRLVTAITTLLISLYAAGYAGLPVHKLRLYYSIPVSKTYWQQTRFIASALDTDEAIAVLPDTEPLGGYDLPGLAGDDVIVQFLESYGAAAFDTPGIASDIAAHQAEFASVIAQTSRRVASAYVISPTYGGGSWLAHSSFMTGLDVKDNFTYKLLLTQERPTLASRFAALGYRPVALMPGMRSEWPEGMFYRFASIYGSRALDYRGPEFGWWRIPDQYSLARLAELEMTDAPRDPLFVLFTTISSHMPFRPTPPYQPEWTRLLTAEPYDASSVNDAMTRLPEWTNLQSSYAGTLVYTFQYLTGFLRQHQGRDFIWILIGDHQPPASVSGEGARWDVPVHVVSGNDAIIDALLQQGFVEGMTPAQAPLGPLYELPVTLLGAFTRPEWDQVSKLDTHTPSHTE
jgi:hypothetical protein